MITHPFFLRRGKRRIRNNRFLRFQEQFLSLVFLTFCLVNLFSNPLSAELITSNPQTIIAQRNLEADDEDWDDEDWDDEDWDDEDWDDEDWDDEDNSPRANPNQSPNNTISTPTRGNTGEGTILRDDDEISPRLRGSSGVRSNSRR